MKFSALLKHPKRLRVKLEFGSIADWMAIARQAAQRAPVTHDNSEPLDTVEQVRDAFLKRVGLACVQRNPCVDHRELDKMIELSKDFGFEVVSLKLGEGDYQSTPRTSLTLNIERKADDFIPSLFNQRHIYQQLKAMHDNPNVKASYLMVTKPWEEIKEDMAERGIDHKVLITYVGELILMGWPPVFIPNALDFIEIVEYLFRAYYEEPERAKAVNRAIDVVSYDIITFPGVSDIIGVRLINHFGSIKAVINATPEELQEVKGIGEKLANQIYEMVN